MTSSTPLGPRPDLTDRLRRLLAEETAQAAALLAALRHEHEALQGREPQAIEHALQAKLQRLAGFEAVEGQRKDVLSEFTVADNPAAIRRFLDTLPVQQPGELAAQWDQLLKIAATCRDQNRLNGAVVEIGRRHVQRALDILRGTSGDSPTYGPGGRPRHGPATHTLAKA